MHPWDKKYNIAFIIILFAGIGLCAGGIYLPPLLIPGGVCLAGAFGMYASAYTRMYPWKQDEQDITVAAPAQQPITITNNIGIFYLFKKFSSRRAEEVIPVISNDSINRPTLV